MWYHEFPTVTRDAVDAELASLGNKAKFTIGQFRKIQCEKFAELDEGTRKRYQIMAEAAKREAAKAGPLTGDALQE